MKKIVLLVVAVFSLYVFLEQNPGSIQSYTQRSTTNEDALASAFENRKSNIQVNGSGVVIRNLADDTSGSRHQKFILRLATGQTLLVSHNIDLAPRISSLGDGDVVDFFGEYEWTAKGGVVHWTHRDPRGHHADGWLKHNGITYQ